MDVTILQAIQISVWCLFTLRETVIISKTTHIKEKGATASGFTPLEPLWFSFYSLIALSISSEILRAYWAGSSSSSPAISKA